MSENRSNQKSVKPEGLEDKALQPATEDKSVSPAEPEGVKFQLSAHYQERGPGDIITVPENLARSLAAEGYGQRVA